METSSRIMKKSFALSISWSRTKTLTWWGGGGGGRGGGREGRGWRVERGWGVGDTVAINERTADGIRPLTESSLTSNLGSLCDQLGSIELCDHSLQHLRNERTHSDTNTWLSTFDFSCA